MSSFEARTKAVKPQSLCCVQIPCAHVQKRVFTCDALQMNRCITEDAELVGFTQVPDDKAQVKPKTEVREGPKAGHYAPKKRTRGVGKYFPEFSGKEKPFVCEKEKINMLVTTGDFRERKDQAAPETKQYRTNDTAPWPVSGVYKPDPNDRLAKSVNEIRVEFNDNKVRQGDKLPGRVFLDLKEPMKLDDVTVDLNRMMVGVDKDGTVKPLDGYGSLNEKIFPHKPTEKNTSQSTEHQPNTFCVVPTVDTPSKVTLSAGTHEIPFKVKVPKDAIPSFNYVSPKDGASVHNTYSTEGVARLDGKPARTDRVTTDVKSLGDTRQGLGEDFGDDVIAERFINSTNIK